MYSQEKNAVIDLKLWIFKFVRVEKDEFAVCVEGYRKKDVEERELENWRSTAIKERYNSVTLSTISGSKYILHGVLDQDSAYGLGYPKILIERFKDGFPYEWRELLDNYYISVVKPNKLNTSQRLHSVLLSGVLLDTSKSSRTDGHRMPTFRNVFGGYETPSLSNSSTKRPKYMSIKDKIVEEDEQISKEKLSASKSSDGSMNLTSRFPKSLGTTFEISRHDSNEQKCGDYFASASNDKSRMEIMPGEKELFCDRPQEDLLFKMPLLPLHQRESKPVELYNWTIRFSANDLGHSKLFPNFAFVIVGFRPDKNLDWKTSCIVAVEGCRSLQTETGVYELMGPINTILAMQQGFPKEFVTQFLNGFPKDWHRILSLFFNTYIEPQLLPQQSLTISEIHDDDDLKNLHHPDFEWSVNSSDSESQSSDSDGSSLHDSFQNCGKDLETERFISRKSVRYRLKDSYQIKAEKGRSRQSKGSILPSKRMKLERKNTDIDSADLSLLRKTRSGRTIKPRLATWTGQRIVYNVHGSPIKAIGITTDSIYSTSTSDLSSSTHRETNLRQALRKGNQKIDFQDVDIKRVPLVAYNDSRSSSFDDDEDEYDDRKLSPPTPMTPFYGKRGHHNSRMIVSSPEENIKRKVAKRHKLRKHLIRNCKEIPTKQKNISKKLLKARNAEKKDDRKGNSVKETVPIVSFSDADSENGIVKNTNKGKDKNTCVIGMTRNGKPRKWTENDNTRLKLAVRAVCPQNGEHWKNIAASMRTRTAEECREQALEVLKLCIPSKKIKTMDMSADVVDAFRKTKVGTLAHQIQADRFTRQYLKAGDNSDFFEETMNVGSNGRKVAMMPSVTTFDSDDSLLSVLRTPTPKSIRRNILRNKLIRIPESPGCSTPRNLSRDSYTPFKFDPDDETYRERQLRYVHKMLKVRNQCSRSRANATKSSISKSYHLHVPTTQCYEDDSDKESEPDEYFDEDEN